MKPNNPQPKLHSSPARLPSTPFAASKSKRGPRTSAGVCELCLQFPCHNLGAKQNGRTSIAQATCCKHIGPAAKVSGHSSLVCCVRRKLARDFLSFPYKKEPRRAGNTRTPIRTFGELCPRHRTKRSPTSSVQDLATSMEGPSTCLVSQKYGSSIY